MKNYIKELRSKFKKYEIDGYVIPKNDDYFTEYSKLNRLEVISNFSGSAGLAIILKNKNYLFTDGRYTIQSKIESGKNFKIYGFEKLINCSLFKNLTLGIDPKLFTNTQIKNYFLKHNKIKYVEKNLIDEIKKQKEHTSIPFFSLDKNIVGESINSKLNKITKYLKKNKCDYIFISAPENVAWTLNIRGGDGPNSPIPNSRLIVSKSKKILLISNLKKCKQLLKNKIIKKDEFLDVNTLPSKILHLKGKNFIVDDKSCSIFYENLIKSKFKIIKREDPIYLLKAIKNKTEIKNMIEAHIKDGVAVTKFLYWIKNSNIKKLDEIKVEKKLESFRKQSKNYLFPSFSTIAGSGPNGAIIHYRSNKKSNRKLNKDHLLLVDSGGQYKWGTTDITRTISFSDPSKKTKELYTRVLKGHIAVAMSKIDKLKNGNNIDKLARKSLNSINLDYRHGTGHGVGFFMNVHEGPQSISKNNFIKLKKGMIVSNEPGIYLENKLGIRIENLVYIDGNNKNLFFKNLTFAPLEKDLINENMLTKIEKDYIFSYHLETYSKLSAYLNNKERKWLAKLIQ